MDGTKPYKFIGIGAMDGTKPNEFIGFGAMDGTKPYESIGFGAMDGTKAYKSSRPAKTHLLPVKQPFCIFVFGLDQELATRWPYNWSAGLALGAFCIMFRA